MSPRRSISKMDRISGLPDSVICHILSFLPTKLIVPTSILSKRWTPLWKSVLTLNFDEDDFEDYGSFRHFVNSVIILRDATLPIRSFSIRCNEPDPRDLNLFVKAAVQRGLEIFDIDLVEPEFDLPKFVPSILSCRTLVVLKLDHLTIGEIPYLVDLPLLKTLHLIEISFVSHFVHAMNLFNGCPILEDLYTDDVKRKRCYSWHDLEGEFSFPNLVRASLHDHVQNFPFTWLHNAKFMSFEVTVPTSTYKYRVPTFHNLTHMELWIYHWDSEFGKWMIQVLQHCPKLQNLTIHEVYIKRQVVEDKDWKDPETVPECLSSQLRTCSISDFNGTECDLQFAKYIMLNSKLLRTMEIESGYWGDVKENHQMLEKLSSYPRSSTTCELLFVTRSYM